MKVLMYGWEFPPKNRGGLGIACKGIVDGLLEHGVKVNLVLPAAEDFTADNFTIINSSSNFKKIPIDAGFLPYQTAYDYVVYNPGRKNNIYGSTLFDEVTRYGSEAAKIAKKVDHDVIHAHDWMTYPAAIEAKKISRKPLVLHLHATEYDRSGEHPNPLIVQIEKIGFEAADKIIAVSSFTKSMIVKHYQIDPEKIVVIHNAVTKKFQKLQTVEFRKDRKTVLFLGRITMQKGPEYFLQAAKKVLEVEKNVNFLMAGDGDMMAHMIHYAHELGIERHVLFSGFLGGRDVDRVFQSADLFVMPSVSEPFGIAALEAIKNGVPVIVSKQAGVNEVITNMLRVDFWDIDEMANKMVMTLRHKVLADELKKLSANDLEKISWKNQAAKIKNLYHSVT